MQRYLITDRTYLSVHPRTLLWWKEREQCLRCVHSFHVPIRDNHISGGQTSCTVVQGAPEGYESCISAREGNLCGPDAKLFVPINTVGPRGATE